ncbi:hypothetical protein ACWT_8075 [Actinoplanes sp. SE50]|uniref:GTPase-associated protein 1-related protein n=1 Tax=unclassified Actinoplanes TaxID=2626549 RepID=UPI00023EDCC6|nr:MULTISPECIES: GTPase-associated protein 1-related protein [unclassified Actinoplanes]AEV89084.1 hypothetical protein ACPL_8206 [Actinoplanes sp. SE50/110]ATO87490.1 hypothetical protein ACWT_8075 [Actinoplanes sp. SE50]SLM04908.1 hypothetical protein ACSP50_8220 [Actinoplanes sp. SE50/110]
MGVPQMYYTSCLSGLSGFPGFQFNAVTPGISEAVLRRVEQATAYQPPRSLGWEPTAEQIADAPVNLCYLPGEPAVLARTVFVGTDYSHRLGNYFVHALSLPAGFEGARPIDFWAADFWVHTESDSRELPELTPVPAGRPDPSPEIGRLPRMLTAVARAVVAEGRPVIVVAERSADVARCIGALCDLLPPGMVRRFAFATYQYQPGRGREHLIGTVPGSGFEVTEPVLRSFAVFDLTGGPESAADEHPLAELLTAAGPENARILWDLAGDYAAAEDFDGWYPAVAAAALCERLPVTDGDLAAVLDWLPGNAARLGPRAVAPIAEACLDHEALTLPQCLTLVEVAAGDPDLRAAAEVSAFDMLLRDPSQAPAPRLETPEARRYARQQVLTRLDGAVPGADTAAVLDLAVRAGVELTDQELTAYGRELILPLILVDPRPLGDVPALRRGVLQGLARVAGDPGVLPALEQLGAPDAELQAYPALQRLLQLSRAATDPAKRVPALRLLGPDRAVLAALWAGGWGLEEAAEVIREAPDEFWESAALVELLDRVLARTQVPPGGWPHYVAAADFAAVRELTGRMSPAARTHVEQLRAAREMIRSASPARAVVDYFGHVGQPARAWLGSQLPALLVTQDARALAELLPAVPPEIRRHYRDQLSRTLDRRPADLAVAATTFELLHTHPKRYAELDEVLTATVARWKTRDLDDLERFLAKSTIKGLPGYVRQWRETRVPGRFSRFLPRKR